MNKFLPVVPREIHLETQKNSPSIICRFFAKMYPSFSLNAGRKDLDPRTPAQTTGTSTYEPHYLLREAVLSVA